MNNTTRTLATEVVTIFMIATLVVGIGTLAATTTTTTQSAFAAAKKGGDPGSKDKVRHNGKENANTDTDTIQKCKQFGSGFDPQFGDQNCEINENSNISEAVQQTPPTPKTCEECLTTFLTPQQITALVVKGVEQCELSGHLSEDDFRFVLSSIGVSGTTADELIACLKNVGFVFLPPV